MSRMTAAHRETATFSLLACVFWASIVSVEGFLVPYLVENAYTPSQTGLVMSAIFLFSIPGQPIWGHICDRMKRHRSIFVLNVLIAAGAMLLVPAVVAWVPLVLAVAMLYSMTTNSMPGILDGWIMARRARVPGLEYGIARGMGSLGYALFAVILGTVYDQGGLPLIFPVFAGLSVTAGLIAWFTPDSDSHTVTNSPAVTVLAGAGPAPAPTAPVPDSLKKTVRIVWNNHRYRVFLVASFLLFVAFRATYTFLPVLIAEVGGGNRHVGWAHSIGAGTEIPVLFLVGWILRRIRAERAILIAMGILVVRMAAYAFVRSPGAIIALQALHGPSFGLFLAASVYYIDRIAPENSKSLYQALAPSIYFGAGSVIGSALGGIIVDNLGVRPLYLLAPLLMLAASLLFFFDSRCMDQKYSQEC